MCSLAEAKINGFKWTIPTHHTHVHVLVAHARAQNPSPREIHRTWSLRADCMHRRLLALLAPACTIGCQLACRDQPAACRCHASYTRPCPCCTCTRAKSLSVCDPPHMLLPVGMVRDHDQVRRQAPGARRQLACRDQPAACRCHASYTRPCPCCTCTRAKSLSACDPPRVLLPVGMVRDQDQVRHQAPGDS